MNESQVQDIVEATTESLQTTIAKLQADLTAISDEYYRNNFSNSQDFQKYSRFNTRIKIPHVASLATTCEVGELCESSGKAYICSSANVWTIIGTQT
jgi:hypothetical protein